LALEERRNMDRADVIEMLRDVLKRGRVNVEGEPPREITGAVSLPEAIELCDAIVSNGFRRTLETGVANGVSTLAMCGALSVRDLPGSKHVGVDPCQFTDHGGAALALLAEHDLGRYFELVNKPMHVGAVELLERDVRLDLAFIDGWHTFDYALIDFFYVDKMLEKGGLVAVHDTRWPAVRKVVQFALSHRRYRLRPYKRVDLARSLYHMFKDLVGLQEYVRYAILGRPNLLFLEKEDDWEPRWDFYRKF
jgi:predicted O-methyltransferase YrrM